MTISIQAAAAIPIGGRQGRKRTTSCGASWIRNAARRSSRPNVRRSSLKSPSLGDSGNRLDAGCLARADVRAAAAPITGRIGVAGDVEAAQRRREQQGGEVVGRERRGHRHGRQHAAQRQHGLDAFAGSEHVIRHAEADGIAEQIAHRPSRRIDRRLAEPIAIEALRIEPGAVHAGDPCHRDR